MRQYGMTKKRAREQWAGFEIGRMALAGHFGAGYQAQKAIDAVEGYVEATADFMRLKCPLHPLPKAMDYLAGRGASLVADPSPAYVHKVEARYQGYLDRLSRADGIDRMMFHEAAFHDRLWRGEQSVAAVQKCINLLCAN